MMDMVDGLALLDDLADIHGDPVVWSDWDGWINGEPYRGRLSELREALVFLYGDVGVELPRGSRIVTLGPGAPEHACHVNHVLRQTGRQAGRAYSDNAVVDNVGNTILEVMGEPERQ